MYQVNDAIINLLKKITFLGILGEYLDMRRFKKKWRKLNSHNEMRVVDRKFPIQNVKVGKLSYGSLHVQSLLEQQGEELVIGNLVSIAPGVKFLLGVNHQTKTVSTNPFYSKLILQDKRDALIKGPIIVEDEVWIGTDAIIMSNVKIGKGAIIGAGSIVTKDVLPYSIVGGNPAKLIRFRFTQDIIDELMKINLVNLNADWIRKHIDIFYSEIRTLDDAKRFNKLINNTLNQ